MSAFSIITTNVVSTSKGYYDLDSTWTFKPSLRISDNFISSLSAAAISYNLLLKQGYDISSSKLKFQVHAMPLILTTQQNINTTSPMPYFETENGPSPPDSQDSSWNSWTDAERGGVMAASILACLFFLGLSYWCASQMKRRRELEQLVKGRARHRRRRRSHRP